MRLVPLPSEPFPSLGQFLGAYLHQDWDMDHASADAAIDAAIRDRTSPQLAFVLQELETIAAGDDASVEASLRRLCDYHPPGDGRTYRGWLVEVTERVRRAV